MTTCCTKCEKMIEPEIKEQTIKYSMNNFDENMKMVQKIIVCPVCKNRILNTKLDDEEEKRLEVEYTKLILEKLKKDKELEETSEKLKKKK